MAAAIVCGLFLFGCCVRSYSAIEKSRAEHRKEIAERSERGNSLQAIFDNAPVEIYLKDVEGRYVQINRRFEELFNVTNEGLKGKFPNSAHDPELGERTRQHDLRVLETGEVVIREEHAETAFGSRVLHTIKFPVFDDNGDIRGLGAIVSDITDIKNAEAALRESTQRWNAVLQNAPVAIHLKDMEGRYQVVNHAAELLFNCSSERLLGRTLEEIQGAVVDFDQLDKILETEKTVMQSGKASFFEVEQEMNGKAVVLEVVKFPVLDERGTVLGIGGMEIDITARRQAENAIRLSEERFRDFSAAGSDWYWELDENLCYTVLSHGGLDARKYPTADVIGVHRAAYRPDGIDDATWEEHLNDLYSHRPFRDFIQPRKLPNGDEVWLSVNGIPLFDEDGVFRGFRGTATDITENRKAEKRIRESEARLQALFENASEGMFIRDVDGYFQMANITFANRIGSDDVTEIVGKTLFDIYPQDDARIYRQDDINCMETGHVSSTELSFPLPNGHEMIQFAIKFPIVSEDGTVMGVGGIDIDITDRKKLERMKNEFISTVSHELRTPLTSIKGSLGLVVDGALGSLPSRAENMVDIAYRNTNRLINLVNDMLDIEKFASEGMEIDLQKLDISALVAESVEAEHGFLAEYGERRIVTDITPDVMVAGDSRRLNQVIANLLSNAIKFSPEDGEIRIVVSIRHGDACVSISDDGVGIPEEFKERIFERFSQADSSDTRLAGGTGLGLNISRSIVRSHGGNISFDSEVGLGSTFYFTLPVVA